MANPRRHAYTVTALGIWVAVTLLWAWPLTVTSALQTTETVGRPEGPQNVRIVAASLPVSFTTFSGALRSLRLQNDYVFGGGPGTTVTNLGRLQEIFEPYSVAHTTVIHQEWQRFQPFNSTNFVFTPTSLDLTATIPEGGGLFAGGIHSGQLWTKDTYRPGVTGHRTYAFEVRMKINGTPGMQCSSWFYTKQWDQVDSSEIDNPEFFVMDNQNSHDWSGFNHGPGLGRELYSRKHNSFFWRPGIDFSADFHRYQTLWTHDAVYKYVDGDLIHAQAFRWTAPGTAQLGVVLGVGSDAPYLPGLRPTALAQFPAKLSIASIRIWAD